MKWTYEDCLLFLKDTVTDLSVKELELLISYLKVQKKLQEWREKLK